MWYQPIHVYMEYHSLSLCFTCDICLFSDNRLCVHIVCYIPQTDSSDSDGDSRYNRSRDFDGIGIKGSV